MQIIEVKYNSYYNHYYLWTKVLKCKGCLLGMENGIIPVIPLPRLERIPSGQSFSYSLYSVLFFMPPNRHRSSREVSCNKIDSFKANFHNTLSLYMQLCCWLYCYVFTFLKTFKYEFVNCKQSKNKYVFSFT